MEAGKISAALRCIGNFKTGVLDITPDVIKTLNEKHPPSSKPYIEGLFYGPHPRRPVEEVIHEDINARMIFEAAKKVSGAAGPSGADSDLWARILCSKQFKTKPSGLCASLADIAKKLKTAEINPHFLRAYTACRLIPLDKKPGVRPIGIGEVVRRIIGRATTTLLKPELTQATAPLKTRAGLRRGIEASKQATRKKFEEEDTETILLVAASNAFNALNRKAALQNIQYTCPEFATFSRNIYRCETELFLPGSKEILISEEGTTLGGPESMRFYAEGTTPLTQPIKGILKIFYADDGTAGGKLKELYTYGHDLQKEGPLFGYFPNASKTWLITKP